MSAVLAPAGRIHYFGKLPSRGDFVRSSAGSPLIHGLDQWLSQTVAAMTQDARWKIVYDAAEPVHFAILGTQSRVGLVGHLSASQDSGGRRFPFVAAMSFETADPARFLLHCPQTLSPLWHQLNGVVGEALHAPDFTQVQGELLQPGADAALKLDMPDVSRGAYADFLQTTSIGQFDALLSHGDTAVSFRQTVLALGLLLQPVATQGTSQLSKGLALPLPAAGLALPQALTLWVELVARFFRGTAAELALLVTVQRGRPALIVGFRGASPVTLRTALDAEANHADNVDVADAQWVEDGLGTDYGLRKLSNLLRDPALSLAAATGVFRETFFGD